MAYELPIQKGGYKLLSKHYRPRSLTSHVITVTESHWKNMLKHLTNNYYISKAQHGFVPWKTTQIQLLIHYKKIYKTVNQGKGNI